MARLHRWVTKVDGRYESASVSRDSIHTDYHRRHRFSVLPYFRSTLGALDARRTAAGSAANVRPTCGVLFHSLTTIHGCCGYVGSQFATGLVELDGMVGACNTIVVYSLELDHSISSRKKTVGSDHQYHACIGCLCSYHSAIKG